MLDNFSAYGNGYFVMQNETAIGGFILSENILSAPFLIPPFNDVKLFWSELFSYFSLKERQLMLQYIPDTHEKVLAELGGKKVRSKQQMIRPTEQYNVYPECGFYFDIPVYKDKDEMAEVIYTAHKNGYIGTTEGSVDRTEIEKALSQRLEIFLQTQTLEMGTVIKNRKTDRIAAICIAGIYPDVPTRFATIHQVAVLPEFRRRGFARSIILNTINEASKQSQAVILGVLKGNPAEKLYHQLGFRAGCSYSDYLF